MAAWSRDFSVSMVIAASFFFISIIVSRRVPLSQHFKVSTDVFISSISASSNLSIFFWFSAILFFNSVAFRDLRSFDKLLFVFSSCCSIPGSSSKRESSTSVISCRSDCSNLLLNSILVCIISPVLSVRTNCSISFCCFTIPLATFSRFDTTVVSAASLADAPPDVLMGKADVVMSPNSSTCCPSISFLVEAVVNILSSSLYSSNALFFNSTMLMRWKANCSMKANLSAGPFRTKEEFLFCPR